MHCTNANGDPFQNTAAVCRRVRAGLDCVLAGRGHNAPLSTRAWAQSSGVTRPPVILCYLPREPCPSPD